MEDHYRALGIPYDATPEEIRAAYFDLARKLHPDVNPDKSAQTQFITIQKAYDILGNTNSRADYDSNLPAATRQVPDISVNVKFSRSVVPRLAENQLMYVLVELICTGEVEYGHLPPFHICVVIDRSTSMQGSRMDMVKAAATQLLRQFRPQDLISVVAFSDRAEVVIPPTRVSDMGRDDTRINLIRTGGGTEIYQGLQLGAEQLRSIPPGVIRQLVLLTDGHTYGDNQNCVDLASELAKEEIVINSLGIGHEWNDELLDKVSSISGGNAMLVSTPKDLNKFFENKLNQLSSIYARGLALEFTSDPGVHLRYAFRLQPETGPVPVEGPIQLGVLPYQKSLSVLFEFLLPAFTQDTETVHLIRGQIGMEIPSWKSSRARIRLDLSRPVSSLIERETPPSQIVEAMARLTLYRMQERVQQEVAVGQIEKATRHLHYLATNLLAQGDRELAHTVLIEAEHIQQSRRFSKEGDKRIKYGTRALLLPASLEPKP